MLGIGIVVTIVVSGGILAIALTHAASPMLPSERDQDDLAQMQYLREQVASKNQSKV